jgi:transposase-like protein
MNTTDQIKELYSSLASSHKTELLDELLIIHEQEGVLLDDAREEVSQKRKSKPCPHCGNIHVYKRGVKNGVQSYSCKSCKKYYRETTGTPLFSIQLKDKWQSYLGLMERGFSIKKIAKELDISIQTSFDWRHKILSSLEQFIPKELAEIVECDELEFSLSNKGEHNLIRKPRQRANDFKRNKNKDEISTVQIITAVERNTGNKFFKVVETKRLSKEQIAKALDGKLAAGTTLITDKHYSYLSYTKDNDNITHKRLLAKEHVDKGNKYIHLQKVNNVHSQVRDFIRPFNGVSSKYLQNYLNWYAYQDKIRNSKTTLKMWFITILLSSNAYSIYELFKNNEMVIRT